MFPAYTHDELIARYSAFYSSELSRRTHPTHPLDPDPVTVADMRQVEVQLGMTQEQILAESYEQVFGGAVLCEVDVP